MPNVLFTNHCNRACSYCFAREAMAQEGFERCHLSVDDLVVAADRLSLEPRGRRFSIIGGEPSLHPDFVPMVTYLLSRQFEVRIFTNGMWSPDAVDAIAERATAPQLRIIVNMNEPAQRTPREERLQAGFFARLAPLSILSLNLHRSGLPHDFVVDAYRTHPLQRTLRVSLSHPVVGWGGSRHNRGVLCAIAGDLVGLAEALADEGVKLSLDCGFPLCIFDNAQLGSLYRLRAKLAFSCHPVVDIGPDLEVWPCFPLGALRLGHLTDYASLDAIRARCVEVVRRLIPDNAQGIFPECADCAERRRGVCAGGCRGHLVDINAINAINQAETAIQGNAA